MNNRETDFDELLPDPSVGLLSPLPDDIPTGRDHEIPELFVSPSVIPGAPDWANEFIAEIRRERRELAEAMIEIAVLGKNLIDTNNVNSAMLKKSFDGMRREMRERVGNLEGEAREDRDEREALEQRVGDLEIEIRSVRARVSALEDDGR